VCAAAPEPSKPAADADASKAPPASAASSTSLLSAVTDNFVSNAVYDNVIAPYAEPSRDKLLRDIPPQVKGREKPTLVVSLDGTLIESQWTRQFGWRYVKRPGVDDFLRQLAPLYELVLWTECQNSAEPVIDRLDPAGPQGQRLFQHRLYRDATTYTGGEHKKDLSALNRDLDKTLIIDCAASAYSLHPDSGIAIKSYRAAEDPNKEDKALRALIPFLQFLALNLKLKGSATPFREELQALGVSTSLDDGGESFEKAVIARFDELKAQGKLPMQRGGRGSLAAAAVERCGSAWA